MSDTSSKVTRDHVERWAQWALGACIFTGWALLSFDGLAELGRQVVGWDSDKALLLPLTVDALVAVTFLMAARATRTDWALLGVAAGAAAVSFTGNGVAWLYEAGMAVPGPVAVFLVSGLAPLCGYVFLHLIMRRSSTWTPSSKKTPGGDQEEEETTPAQPEVVSSSGRTTSATSPKSRARKRRGSVAATGPRSGGTASPGATTPPAGTAPAVSSSRPTDEQRVDAIRENGWHDLTGRDLNARLQALGLGTTYSKLPELVARASSNGHAR